MTRFRSLVGAGVFAAAVAIAVPAVAAASAPPEPSAPATTPAPNAEARLARLKLACARVPKVETRVDTAITLLQSDADTRGSIAWLNAQLAKAQTNNRTELATVIQNRIDVRTARLALLQERKAALTEIASVCDAHGFGA